MKCKAKREFTDQVDVVNNRRMAKGAWLVCGTTMNRILGKG